jgi:hypothetical protein
MSSLGFGGQLDVNGKACEGTNFCAIVAALSAETQTPKG